MVVLEMIQVALKAEGIESVLEKCPEKGLCVNVGGQEGKLGVIWADGHCRWWMDSCPAKDWNRVDAQFKVVAHVVNEIRKELTGYPKYDKHFYGCRTWADHCEASYFEKYGTANE